MVKTMTQMSSELRGHLADYAKERRALEKLGAKANEQQIENLIKNYSEVRGQFKALANVRDATGNYADMYNKAHNMAKTTLKSEARSISRTRSRSRRSEANKNLKSWARSLESNYIAKIRV